jgi:mono/diheme cytochrome c family protein
MTSKILRVALILTSVVCLVAAANYAQEKSKEIKRAPIKMTSAASGSEMFNSYCAACHGKDAKGDGPAASALKVPPSNLTLLAQKNGGKFPAGHVAQVLRGGLTAAHGSVDMPTWGPLFRSVSERSDAIVQMRISNLIHYLESIQEK